MLLSQITRRQRLAMWNRCRCSLHTGRASRIGTQNYFKHRKHAAAVVPKTNWAVSRIGTASSAWDTADLVASYMKRIEAIRDPVLHGHNNFVQLNKSMGVCPEVDMIAVKEILKDGQYSRDQLVLSAVVDNTVDHQTTIAEEIQSVLSSTEIEALDLVLVRVSTVEEIVASLWQALEEQVERGRIQTYGFAFRAPPSKASLEKLVVPSEHFVAVQFPVNALELEAVKNGAIEYCKANSLFAIGERPIEAINRRDGGKPMYLKECEVALDGDQVAQELKQAFEFALKVEARYMNDLEPNDADLPPAKEICWGHILAHQQSTLTSYPEWIHIRDRQILPKFESTTKFLVTEKNLRDFAYAYTVSTKQLLQAFTKSLELLASEQAKAVKQQLDLACPSVAKVESLLESSILVALSSQVDSVLTEEHTLDRSLLADVDTIDINSFLHMNSSE